MGFRRVLFRFSQKYQTNAPSYDTGVFGNVTSGGCGTLSTGTFNVIQPTKPIELIQMSNRRIVQVFIADPNESVPLENSLLYQDEKPHLTDLTDQELFFEIDIRSILEKHNKYRVTVVNKE